MIIQLRCKGQNRYLSFNRKNKNKQNYKSQESCLSTINEDKITQTIKIKIPFKKNINQNKNRYRFCTYNQGGKGGQTKIYNQQEVKSKSLCFKSIFQQKKTCGNMRDFLQVVHKKIRAKNIQQSFEHANTQLYRQFNTSKGFKGGKVTQYSLFHNNPHHKLLTKSVQKVKTIQLNKTWIKQEQQIDKGLLNFVKYDNQKSLIIQKQQNQEQKQIKQFHVTLNSKPFNNTINQTATSLSSNRQKIKEAKRKKKLKLVQQNILQLSSHRKNSA